MIQWNKPGRDLVYGDQVCGGSITGCIYSVSISGSSAEITGSAALNNIDGGPTCDVVQAALGPQSRFVAGSDWEGQCNNTPSSSERWPYSAGGNPSNYNDSPSFSLPIGTAISS